jgi:hypothetical protein
MEHAWKNKLLGCGLAATATPTEAAEKKPNIVVIMWDDIGMWNIGAYHKASCLVRR